MFVAHQDNQSLRSACEVKQLGIFRREAWLLHDLSFTIAQGECWLLTGQNGSGKTTLLRLLAGLSLPDTGSVIYPNGTNAEPQWLYLAAPPATIPELSVIDNICFQAILRWGRSPDLAVLNKALVYWGIEHLSRHPMATLSLGQQQRVALSVLLLGHCQLWLLDEPTTGLDAMGIAQLWVLCCQHQAKGGSLLIATHQEPPPSMSVLRRIQLGMAIV